MKLSESAATVLFIAVRRMKTQKGTISPMLSKLWIKRSKLKKDMWREFIRSCRIWLHWTIRSFLNSKVLPRPNTSSAYFTNIIHKWIWKATCWCSRKTECSCRCPRCSSLWVSWCVCWSTCTVKAEFIDMWNQKTYSCRAMGTSSSPTLALPRKSTPAEETAGPLRSVERLSSWRLRSWVLRDTPSR